MATKPILLRPPEWLAEAMTRGAEQDDLSRQVWMLNVLAAECLGRGLAATSNDDDQPLPGI